MTTIGDDRRQRPTDVEHPAPDAGRPHRLIRVVQVFAVTAAVAGASCLTVSWCLDHVRAAIVGAALLVLSGVAAAVWVADALVADRNAFYVRGKADGWYEGWRGQLPTDTDPLLPR